MGQIESEAVVLRTYDLAEADKIVVCLTQKAGVIRAVARGAKRLKSRFGAGLEPFTLVNLGYYEKEGRELVTLQHLEIQRSYFGLAKDLEAVSALAYMSELVVTFAPPQEPNEKMYRMVRACLEAMETFPEDVNSILRYFEVWTLKLAGFFSTMRNCAECRQRLGEQAALYLDSELRQRCETCGKGRGTHVSGETHAQLLAIQRQPPAIFVETARLATPATQRELAQMTRRLLNYILERDMREQTVLGQKISTTG
jgi:DNA repair protein RecO (recombination protein O)